MLSTTTHTVQNREVEEYLGIVTGEAILGVNVFRDFFASIRDIVGGRSGGYEKALSRAREIAIKEAEEAAERLGANAVIGIDIDYEAITGAKENSGSMLMVTVCGTAVKLR